jgi:hypothetical protein
LRDSLRVVPFVNDKVAELHRATGLLARAAREAPADPVVRAALRAAVAAALGELESVARELKAFDLGLR